MLTRTLAISAAAWLLAGPACKPKTPPATGEAAGPEAVEPTGAEEEPRPAKATGTPDLNIVPDEISPHAGEINVRLRGLIDTSRHRQRAGSCPQHRAKALSHTQHRNH